MYQVPWASDWTNVDSIDFFFTYDFHVLVKRNGREVRDKIMLPCFREMKCLKCQHGYTAGI